MPTLTESAREKFGELSQSEEQMFEMASRSSGGAWATPAAAAQDLATAAEWGAEQIIRAECLVWVCTDPGAASKVSHRGIEILWSRIDSALFLDNARIVFPISAWNCAFTENISCSGAQLRDIRLSGCRTKGANFSRSAITGSVLLNDRFSAEGYINFARATISGDLQCDGGSFTNLHNRALNLDGANVRGYIFMRNGFIANGEVRLLGTTIGRSLECSRGHLLNPGATALIADSAQIEGYAFFKKTHVEGQLNLLGASIGRNLELTGAQLSNTKEFALNAPGITVKSTVYLTDGFRASGSVNFSRATIGGDLDCWGGEFDHPTGLALNLDAADIKRGTFLNRGFKATGTVRMVGADLGRYVICTEIKEPEKATLDFRYARVSGFLDDERSWPSAGKLFLDGFNYSYLMDKAPPPNAKVRVAWLRRQPRDHFLPQPYEQLATVLRKMGHERDAKLVMIEKSREQRRFTRRFRSEWWWYNLFGRLIKYGYAPSRAFVVGMLIILLGAVLFGLGFSHGLISPSKENAYERVPNEEFVFNAQRKVSDEYPVFNPAIYSLESFTPLLKLDQSANWAPNANSGTTIWLGSQPTTTTGAWLRYYLWLHVIAGWVLTSLWIAALTGLIKN